MRRIALLPFCLLAATSAVAATAVAASGCFANPRACESSRQCFDGEACRNGVCVDVADVDSPTDGDAPASETTDVETGELPCETPETWYRDDDGDGYGDSEDERTACQRPEGDGGDWVKRGGDCDDQRASIHPGATEKCDDVDRDCNGDPGEQPCDNQTGVCEGSTGACGADGPSCGPEDYGPDYRADERRADGLDNDCDGTVDEVWQGVALGNGSACGLTVDDDLHCWGPSDNPVVARAPDGEFSDLALGGTQACATNSDQNVVCWGASSEAIQNRQGSYGGVAVGVGHACAFTENGESVECWGRDLHGATAVPDLEGSKVVDISAGLDFTCARLDSADLVCWGLGSDPESEEGDWDFDQASPYDGEFTDHVTGRFHACAVERSDGELHCWGAGNPDQTDAGAPHFDQSIPPDEKGWKTVAGGWHHTCGVNADDEVVCWGRDGRGPSVRADGPFAGDGTPPDELAAGRWGTCAVAESGTLECWGGPRSPGEPSFSP